MHREQGIGRFRGSSVGVDVYGWLHRASFGAAWELCLGLPTTRHVDFVFRRVQVMRASGVTPVLVLDGRKLDAKALTNSRRATERAGRLEEGLRLHQVAQVATGREKSSLEHQALLLFQKCTRVTNAMVSDVIARCQREGVEIIVAPFEADAQLACLAMNSHIAAILTEDSDLILFCLAAKAHVPVITKLDDQCGGMCLEVAKPGEMARRAIESTTEVDGGEAGGNSRGGGKSKGNGKTTSISFVRKLLNFTSRMFVQMAILSGCDYLDSVKGIGLVTAQKLVLKYRSAGAERRVRLIVRDLMQGRLRDVVPPVRRSPMLQVSPKLRVIHSQSLGFFEPANIFGR